MRQISDTIMRHVVMTTGIDIYDSCTIHSATLHAILKINLLVCKVMHASAHATFTLSHTASIMCSPMTEEKCHVWHGEGVA
jgi:hypothetical protein